MANLVIKGSGATPLSGAGRAGKSSPRGVGRAKAGSSGGAVSPSVAKLRELREGQTAKSGGKESRKEVLEKGKVTQGRRRAVEELLPEPVRDLVYEPLDFDRGQVPETVVSPASTPPTRVFLPPNEALTGVTYTPSVSPYGRVVYRGEVPLMARPTGRSGGAALAGEGPGGGALSDRESRIKARLDEYRAAIETIKGIAKQAREDEAKALAVGLQARDMVSRASSRLADAADRIPETVTGARRFNLRGYPGESVSDIEARVLGLSSDGFRQVGEVVSSPGKGIVAGVKKLDKAVSDVPFVRIVDKLWRSNPEAKFKIRDKVRSWLAKHPGVVSTLAYAGAGYGLASMVSNRNRQVYEEGQRATASVASGPNGQLGLAVIERIRALDNNLSEVASGRVSESNPLASADGVADVLAGIGGAMSRQVGGLLQSVDPADVKLGETIRRQAADDYNRVYQKLAKGLPSDYMASAMQYAADGGSNVTPEAFAASLGLKDWRSDDAK